jgi:hypothetical protein
MMYIWDNVLMFADLSVAGSVCIQTDESELHAEEFSKNLARKGRGLGNLVSLRES